jgi:microcystin-dependent protein
MSAPFVAEIRMFGFNFAPTGWAQCNGQLLPISQNTALFSLLGTFYGGDGKSTFALPNLEGSVPLHAGQSSTGTQYFLGQQSGTQTVTLLQTEMPVHTHQVMAYNDDLAAAVVPSPDVVLGKCKGGGVPYRALGGADVNTTMGSPAQPALTFAGGGLPHNNMMPNLVVNFCIAMQGVFPPRS